MIPRSKWKYYGSPMHFCLSHKCEYHIATLVGDYVVSTVARLQLSDTDDSRNWDEVGFGRYGETYVFAVESIRPCGCPKIAPEELYSTSYTKSDVETCSILDSGHDAMCVKWAKKQRK